MRERQSCNEPLKVFQIYRRKYVCDAHYIPVECIKVRHHQHTHTQESQQRGNTAARRSGNSQCEVCRSEKPVCVLD